MKPKLRADAEIMRSAQGSFIVGPRGGPRRFRAGPEERFLLGLLDGRHTLAAIQREFQQQFEVGLRERHLAEFLNQLRLAGLLETGGADEVAWPATASGPEPGPGVVGSAPMPPSGWAEPSGAGLNQVFDVLVLLLDWLLHPIWMVPVLMLVTTAIAGVIGHGGDFVRELWRLGHEAPVLLVPRALTAKLVFLDLPRALMLGVACRSFGGAVRSFGFRLHRRVLPMIVCDIGESAAPMAGRAMWTVITIRLWTQVTITSLAVLLFVMSVPAAPIRAFCALVALLGSIGLIVMLNLFGRSDAYAILVALLDVPRIRERARAETRAWLGFRPSAEALTDRERTWLRVFGLVSLVLTPLLHAGVITLAAWWFTQRYDGLGALAVTAACLAWYWRPIKERFAATRGTVSSTRPAESHPSSSQRWRIGKRPPPLPWHKRRLTKWTVRALIFGGIVGLGFLPYEHTVTGECHLVPAAQQGVRAQITDEVTAVHVRPGDRVEAGDLLVTLSGREVIGSIKKEEANLKNAEAELALLERGTRPETIEMAAAEVERLEIELAFQEKQLDRAEALVAEELYRDMDYDQVLRNRDTTRMQLESARQGLAHARTGPRAEEIDAARARVARIKSELEYLYGQRDLLEIRSPIAGSIVTSNVTEREGQVAERGELIALVADTSTLGVEIAADQAASVVVSEGMPVQVRLNGLDGRLLHAQVERVDPVVTSDRDFEVEPVRTDREGLIDRGRERIDEVHCRVRAVLDQGQAEGLVPRMTGVCRVVVGEDIFWRALARPIVRFFRTDVWSWLP